MIADPITLTVLGVLVGVRACTLDNSRLFHVSPHADHRGRTYNLALKRRLLWPIELRRRVFNLNIIAFSGLLFKALKTLKHRLLLLWLTR